MIKIIITGPESTGKSTLAKNVSNYLKEPFVPEYARFFMPTISLPYSASNLRDIAHGQLYWHTLYKSKATNWLVCDTGVEAVDIWHLYRFGGVDEVLRKLFVEDESCCYLLCKPDIPWVEDPLRETPWQRPEIFNSFIALMENHHKKYHIVEGQTEEERLGCALQLIKKIAG
jgi:nicotinamide riboside kinase